MKRRLLTLIVAVASALTVQMALTSTAEAANKKSTAHHKKHHKHNKKTADAGKANPAA